MINRFQMAHAKKKMRIESGADPVVAGWQCFLEEMLIKIEPYFIAGRVITFQELQPREQETFAVIDRQTIIPENAWAVFIPPSVMKRMTAASISKLTAGAHALPSGRDDDAGILLACRSGDYNCIINSLFAFPPYMPGVDVYEDGRMLAGYTFNTVEECVAELSKILRTYLKISDAGH
jgi:hypothetical protein